MHVHAETRVRSARLNQHVSINTVNNTRENVWLSPKKCLKHFAQIVSLSHYPFLAFPKSLAVGPELGRER